MRSKQLGFTITELTILIVWILSIVGWVANIVKVVHMGMPVDLAHMSIMFVLRIIGIFIPHLGVVLGFM